MAAVSIAILVIAALVINFTAKGTALLCRKVDFGQGDKDRSHDSGDRIGIFFALSCWICIITQSCYGGEFLPRAQVISTQERRVWS